MDNWRYRGPRKAKLATFLLSLTILALFASTTVYMVINMRNYEASSLEDLLLSTIDFCNSDPLPGDFLWNLTKDDLVINLRGGTAAVIVNVCLPRVFIDNLLTPSLEKDYPWRCHCMLEGMRHLGGKSCRTCGLWPLPGGDFE